MSLKGVELPVVFRFINAIYRALAEEFGEASWDVLWRSGEILFHELKEEIGIKPDMEINHAIQKLCDYLRNLRLVEKIEFNYMPDKMMVETKVKFPFNIDIYKRESAGPIYIFTSMLVSMLNYLGYTVEREGEHYILDKDKLVERWRLIKRK